MTEETVQEHDTRRHKVEMTTRQLRECGVHETITNLPGNFDVVVFHDVRVPDILQGKGVGTMAHENRLQRAEFAGNSYCLCTVRDDNEPQKKIMKKFKWKLLDTFINECEDKIHIYGRTPT